MMGDITSISKATTTNKSLRTTIPRSIVTQFGLTYNDKLEWIIKAENNQLIIQVKPVKEK